MRLFLFTTLFLLSLSACTTDQDINNGQLKIFGEREINAQGDTIYHSIPDFSFIDQDSNTITNQTFEDKIYVADFFFIHCPSICPKVKAQMMRIYDQFENNDRLVMLSHSIDTRNDSIPALKAYANKLDINTNKWHLVTGEKDLIFDMADQYFVSAMVSDDAPGGFDHSGEIMLIDEKRHIRSHADGTNPEAVDKLLIDIEKLLNEQ